MVTAVVTVATVTPVGPGTLTVPIGKTVAEEVTGGGVTMTTGVREAEWTWSVGITYVVLVVVGKLVVGVEVICVMHTSDVDVSVARETE